MSDSKEDDRMAMNQRDIKQPATKAERKKLVDEALKDSMKQYDKSLRKLSKN